MERGLEHRGRSRTLAATYDAESGNRSLPKSCPQDENPPGPDAARGPLPRLRQSASRFRAATAIRTSEFGPTNFPGAQDNVDRQQISRKRQVLEFRILLYARNRARAGVARVAAVRDGVAWRIVEGPRWGCRRQECPGPDSQHESVPSR